MSLFLDVLTSRASSQSSSSRPPIWLMRQAGRSLKAYQELKKKHTFKTLLKTPSLAREITELPLRHLGVDAAILFSDILVVLEALGIHVDYDAPLKQKPFIQNPLKLNEKLNLKKIDSTKLEHNYETIQQYKRNNSLPLIGFCASPWTTFLYLYEKEQNQFFSALASFYNHSKVSDEILNVLTDISLEYAEKQIASGVDAFQIFDTWANAIPFPDYQKRIEPLVIKMAARLSKKVPVIFFPRFFSNAYEFLNEKTLNNISALSVDYLASLKYLREKLPPALVLQGNFSPQLLRTLDPANLEVYLKTYLRQNKTKRRWIFNLGHGVLPATPEENIRLLVKTVKNFS